MKFTQGRFYGVVNHEQFKSGIKSIHDSIEFTDGFFAADNLIAYARKLSFLSDKAFVDSIEVCRPNDTERSIIWRTHTLCWAAKQACRLQGDFVEAGCYQGYSADVIMHFVNFQEGRKYWLYDLFQHDETMNHHSMPEHGVGLFERVKKRFEHRDNVSVIQGELPASLQQGAPDAIAFMHIDMNNRDAEIGVLDALYERVVPGGVIIFDDFGWAAYHEQADAEIEWFKQRNMMILELPTGQGMVIK